MQGPQQNVNAGSRSAVQHVSTGSWFTGAPLAKGMCLCTVLSYIFAETMMNNKYSGANNLAKAIALDFDKILLHGEVHRMVLYTLCFGSMAEMFVGLGTLYPLVIKYEREMGTHKFVSFLLKAVVLATILQFIFVEFIADVPTLSPGPYPQLGAMLFLFHHYSPRLHPHFFGIFGFDFSEKVITYIFAAQVIISNGAASIVPTVCGFLASYLCCSQKFSLATWDFIPDTVYHIGERFGNYSGLCDYPISIVPQIRPATVDRGARVANRHNAIPDSRIGTNFQGRYERGPHHSIHATSSTSTLPPEEAIEMLTNMGFDREAVIRALRSTDNNIEAAANRLLSGDS